MDKVLTQEVDENWKRFSQVFDEKSRCYSAMPLILESDVPLSTCTKIDEKNRVKTYFREVEKDPSGLEIARSCEVKRANFVATGFLLNEADLPPDVDLDHAAEALAPHALITTLDNGNHENEKGLFVLLESHEAKPEELKLIDEQVRKVRSGMIAKIRKTTLILMGLTAATIPFLSGPAVLIPTIVLVDLLLRHSIIKDDSCGDFRLKDASYVISEAISEERKAAEEGLHNIFATQSLSKKLAVVNEAWLREYVASTVPIDPKTLDAA